MLTGQVRIWKSCLLETRKLSRWAVMIFQEEEMKHLCLLFILVPPGIVRSRAEALISWLSNNAADYDFWYNNFDMLYFVMCFASSKQVAWDLLIGAHSLKTFNINTYMILFYISLPHSRGIYSMVWPITRSLNVDLDPFNNEILVMLNLGSVLQKSRVMVPLTISHSTLLFHFHFPSHNL